MDLIGELSSSFIEMQLASIATFNIRFSHHIMKIDENLHSIFTIIEEPREELENIAAQREKRIRAEFSRRFSRDYLYPTQLKINELENEYLSFISCGNCKIAQSMILRPLVLVLLKKLSSSTQTYLQFLRKTSTKVFVKLKEVVHLISHFLEIIKSIVDHRILTNNDIEKLCSMILCAISNDKQETKLGKTVDKPTKNQKSQCTKVPSNKPILKRISSQKTVKNKVHFMPKSKTEKLKQSEKNYDNLQTCCCSEVSEEQSRESSSTLKTNSRTKNFTNGENQAVLRGSISDLCSKISDLIVNELLTEVVEEINQCFQELAFDAFELEFKS